jgi:magnesium chelatase family protein
MLSLVEAEVVTALPLGARRLLEQATQCLGLSARAYLRILRVARTIADLEQSEKVGEVQVAEAIQGRLLDRETGI